MGNGTNWFVQNIPILGPIVGSVAVIMTGFIYQDKKISGCRKKDDCDTLRKDMKETIQGVETNVKSHLDLKFMLLSKEIKNNGKGK